MNSNDFDARLRAQQPAPRRDVSTDFVGRVVTEIKTHPYPQSTWAYLKESITMKITKKPLAFLFALLAILVIGSGVSYAAIHHFSLSELLNRAPTTQGGVTPQTMQKYYTTYISQLKAGDKDAKSTFEAHTTQELSDKLNKAIGYDPIVCSQDTPTSVTFSNIDSTGGMTAVNHFDGSTANVQLAYDHGSGIFTDITCQTPVGASVTEKMQGYYTQYVTDVRNELTNGTTPMAKAAFLKHVDATLAAQLNQGAGFDQIICAQNIPAMVSFTDSTSSSMTALVAFDSTTESIKLTFNPASQKFTSITCPQVSQ